MAKVAITESYLEDIADAIREKTGLSTATFKPSEMANAISSISGGGITPTGTIEITTNGTHDVTTYKYADVSVSGGGGSPTIDSLSVIPTTSEQTFNSSSVDGYKPVVVAAMPTMTLPTSAAASATSGYTSKATISRSTSDQYINIPTGYNSAGAYYKVSAVANGSATGPSTLSGTSATVSTGTNTLTLTKTGVSTTPTVTAGYVSSATSSTATVTLTASVTTKAAATITPTTTNQTIASGTYLTGAQTISGDANLIAGNIKKDVTIFGTTGTYEGSGGSSKNVQVLQSTNRTNTTSLAKALGDLTVSKTGTYDIYWSGGRSNTSSSYTWGTRLYIDGSGYGTENTTWTNNVQSNHLTNVSLTVNQKLSVYVRGRGGSYYAFAPMLVIIEV